MFHVIQEFDRKRLWFPKHSYELVVDVLIGEVVLAGYDRGKKLFEIPGQKMRENEIQNQYYDKNDEQGD